MSKFTVESTRREAPVRALVYGGGGVGKSTFAASAPSTIFIAAEDGLKNIDAKAVKPFPETWAEALEAIDHVATLDYRTLAIDSLDWLEPLCWEHVCRAAGKKDIEAFGYGKGYTAALDQWRVFLRKLEALSTKKGMGVVLIAHAIKRPFKNPAGDDYDHYTIKLNDKASGLVKEWVDVVGFAELEVVTTEQDGRNKGKSTGKRVLRTAPSAAYDAKTRYAMPKSIPLDWRLFEHAVKEGGAGALARLEAELRSALAQLADKDVTESCNTFLGERGKSVATVTEALETVNTYLAERSRKAS